MNLCFKGSINDLVGVLTVLRAKVPKDHRELIIDSIQLDFSNEKESQYTVLLKHQPQAGYTVAMAIVRVDQASSNCEMQFFPSSKVDLKQTLKHTLSHETK